MADFTFGSSDVIAAGYTGAAKTYEITFNGYIEIKAWGAAGGGGIVHSSIQTTGYRTAGGGYADGRIAVEVGDIIKIEVGQGGRRAETETTGSLGGWPDGGRGTQGTSGAGGNFYRGGGGGGSTRVYKNDVLILVAGASGGGCRYFGGAGGGSTGATGGSGGGVGGTQSAAGAGGGFLDGGDAPLAPNAGSSSGGGGGGYYGGGYATGVDNTAGGGGGSGYRGTPYGQLVQGTNSSAGTAAKSTDPDYAAGVALGGQTLAGPATTTHGGDGRVVMRLNNGADFILVENEQVTLPNDTPSDQIWTIDKGGILTFDLWGAGGGGAYSPLVGGTFPRGGGGGHTRVQFNVSVGDELKVQVGQGGRKGRGGQGNATPVGGGWPDGGHAGVNTSSSASGSGGGSTRVWLNNVLIAVAGAGGGGGIPTRGDPGAGGGATGQSAFDAADGGLVSATGGSQSAGGVNGAVPANTGYWGGYLQGGNGRPAGAGPTTADSACAAGGGGGYYGGGGSGLTGAYFRGGGGGSGYIILGAVDGLTEAGNLGTPAAISNPLYPGGNVGYGGLAAGTDAAAQDGYPGAATYLYEPVEGGIGDLDTVVITGVDATATGGIGVDALTGPLVVTISTPLGAGVVSAGGTGDLAGPVVITGVEATAIAQVGATGSIGTVTILSLLEGGPPQEVNVILDLVAEFDGGVFVDDMPSATATGEGEGESVPFTPPQISVVPVQGFYTSVDQEVEGDLGTVVVTGIDGFAAEAFETVLDSIVTATSFMEASATGAAAISARISFIPENGMGGGLGISVVNGSVSTPDMEATGDIGSIVIEPLRGVGLDGDDIVLAVGVMPDRVELEWTNTDAIQATGGGQAYSVGNASGSNNPADNYLVRVWRNTDINGSVAGASTVTADLSGTITFAAPQGLTIRGQSVFAPIGTIFVRRPFGGGGENPSLEGDALAGYDLRDMPIVITPPDGGFAIDGEAVGQGQLTVVILPPAASADIGQEQAHDLPGPIVLTPPEGAAFAVDADSTAEADLTAVITLLPPEAQPVVPVAVLLPGAVVISPVLATFKLVAISGTVVFIRQVDGEAVFRRVENAVAVVEDRIERTVILRG